MSLGWSQHFWLLPCVNNLDQGSSFTFIKLECKTLHRLAGIPPACETNGPVLFTVKIPPIASEDIKPPGFTFITRPWPCSDSRISLNTLYVRDETLLRKRGRRGCCDWQESRDQMSLNVNSQSLKASIRRLLECAAKFFFVWFFWRARTDVMTPLIDSTWLHPFALMWMWRAVTDHQEHPV